MTETVRIYSKTEHVTFGEGGFVLTELDVGPARILAGTGPLRTGGRTVRLTGVLLPEGDTLLRKASLLAPMRRRLCRLSGAAGGFTLALGEKRLALTATESPRFATKAPLSGPEALEFTLTAQATDGVDAFFTDEKDRVSVGRGWEGKLVFPLAITEETLFALRSPAGSFTVENPGDVPVGFTAVVTAEEAPVYGVTLSLPTGERLFADCYLNPGESLRLDTRPGHKSVTDTEGGSLLPLISPDSTFFTLAPGENRLSFAHSGAGQVTVTVTFSPRYF